MTGPQTADGRLIAGRYRLLSSSGERGLGTIWLAFDEALDREVILDEIELPQRLSRARRAEIRAGLLRAARLASRLEHAAAAKVHDVLEEQGRIWVISEQVPGHPLAELLGEGPLPPRMAAEIGGELLGALVAAHAIGLLHGDVRPDNVWITDEGRVALTG
ncbi:MAG: protein kinase domain-containing protein, partial [Micromonosporaceae bacterium]